jgi:ABC-2 type transport system ATP-binding protein
VRHHSQVLLLDKPASGLDPKARFDLRILLQGLREQGTTILISSHILTELEGFCTSIGIIEKGHLVRSGRIEDVTAAELPTRTIALRWLGTAKLTAGPRSSATQAQKTDWRRCLPICSVRRCGSSLSGK